MIPWSTSTKMYYCFKLGGIQSDNLQIGSSKMYTSGSDRSKNKLFKGGYLLEEQNKKRVQH